MATIDEVLAVLNQVLDAMGTRPDLGAWGEPADYSLLLRQDQPGGAGQYKVEDLPLAAHTLPYRPSSGDIAALSVGTQKLVGRISSDIVAFDVDDLTADGSPDGAADYVMTWDTNASAHKKVLLDDLPGGGDTHPMIDTTDLVKGSVDATKLLRIEMDGLTTDTTRTITMADQNIDLTPDTGAFSAATHATRHTDGNDDVQDATSGQKGLMTSTYAGKLDGIETSADVTDATNVNAAGAVMESDYDAQTILAAVSDNTPVALTVAEQRLVGRIMSGNIDDLTATQVRTLLNVEDAAAADQNLWHTISGDSGSTTPDSTTDTLTLTGGSGVDTSIAGDAATIALGALSGDWNAGSHKITADDFHANSEVFVGTQSGYTLKLDTQTAGYLDFTMGSTSTDAGRFRFRHACANTDINVEFIGTTNSGVFRWREDEDHFKVYDDVLMSEAERIYFRDTDASVHSDAAGELIVAGNTKTTIGVAGDIALGDGDPHVLRPHTDLKIGLGTSSYRFNEAHIKAIVTQCDVTNVDNPPTDAQLDGAFGGTPAEVGDGFMRLLNDAGAGNNVYLVTSDGTNWHQVALTKAV